MKNIPFIAPLNVAFAFLLAGCPRPTPAAIAPPPTTENPDADRAAAGDGTTGLASDAAATSNQDAGVASSNQDAGLSTAKPTAPADTAYRKTVEATISKHTSEIQACFDRAKIQSPHVAGILTIAGTVTRSGHVAGARVDSSTLHANSGDGPKLLESCALERFKAWNLPPPPAGASDHVSHSFRFE